MLCVCVFDTNMPVCNSRSYLGSLDIQQAADAEMRLDLHLLLVRGRGCLHNPLANARVGGCEQNHHLIGVIARKKKQKTPPNRGL